MLYFFLCFRSELATEVVLQGTIRLDSKIRFQNVHVHDSFWREQSLVGTKLFLSLTRIIDFAAAVSSRAVRVFRSHHFDAYGPDTGRFLLWFSNEVFARGCTDHMIRWLIELTIFRFTLQNNKQAIP